MGLTYNVRLNANGIIRFRATVDAREAGIVGDYFNGVPYQPDNAQVIAAIPYRYRKAFQRALKWWQSDVLSGRPPMPLMCHLETLRGKPMGTLYATPNWSRI